VTPAESGVPIVAGFGVIPDEVAVKNGTRVDWTLIVPTEPGVVGLIVSGTAT
jgi:hypothetical protein